MSRKSKYGNMPPAPEYRARVRGDAGVYKVWGVDWLNHKVLLDRAGLEWTPIKNVAFEPLPEDVAQQLLGAEELRQAQGFSAESLITAGAGEKQSNSEE
ncbi:hypothetical protein N5D09_03225 [Stutzerimonas stutzeri]|uniref:Uncharacterized protein n=1 Tax=Stutzerimonas stutzeri TaxID=316 RepID=A0ABD4XWH5_STUST|nr:hypothetical protein [Stutzerimonas stutzeri]MDH0687099.1 hypothetical protein [Stutzerimonas stutzeri]